MYNLNVGADGHGRSLTTKDETVSFTPLPIFRLDAEVVAEPGASYESGPQSERWIEVLLDFSESEKKGLEFEEKASDDEGKTDDLLKLYTYRVPPGLEVKPGDILSVPVKNLEFPAIAIRFVTQLPDGFIASQIKEVKDVVATGFLSPSYWTLLDRVANYYYTPLMQVIRAALPPGLLAKSQHRVRLRPPIPNGAEEFLRNPAARLILQLLQASPTGDYSWKHIQQELKKNHRQSYEAARRGLKDLKQRGYVESYQEQPKQQQPKRQQAIIWISDEVPELDLSDRQRKVFREVLAILKRRNGAIWLTEAIEMCRTSEGTLKALEQTGCFAIEKREILRSPSSPDIAADLPKNLTNHQSRALEIIQNLSGFSQVLLHGVTGSGKTEVYLQAIAPLLDRGESALVLVPEIGLTPQLTDRFRARFGDKILLYHSHLNRGERYDSWRQMLADIPQIVIGTRSAIFAPLPRLGLIILDEEYDSSYKQDQPAPTYHARTVAKWRAELANCPLILGAATPSLETWVEIAGERGRGGKGEHGSRGARERGSTGEREHGREGARESVKLPNPQSPIPNPQSPIPITHYLSLPDRVHARPLPPVEIADMRQELRQGNRSIFSRSLQEALNQLRDRGNQGILFIHRRGYSTFVSCRSCGYVMECPNCDVSLSYHYIREGATEILRCHYCNFYQRQPQHCPECTSPYLKNFGSGSQRVEEELRNQFPQLRSIRFDSDTTRTKGAHRTLLTQFANREADLLVGTQMLAKGLDLPQVTLVGVVTADGLLNMPDYRAKERAFQILTQVAGRAGRGSDPGRVIIQTYEPENPVLGAVQRHEYESFVEEQLQERAALNYSPYGRLILLRLSGIDAAEVEATAHRLAVRLSPVDDAEMPSFELLGPAPAPIMRVANRYRWHILLKFPLDAPVELFSLTELRALCPASVSLTIDVDPLNLG